MTLDGSGSSDVDGDAVTFAWTLTTIPPGSSATLTDPTGVMPTFVLDHAGTYEAQLIVHDGTVNSAPDTVMISTTNSAPVANAGPDQMVDVGLTVTLDGNDSSDVDGDVLTFAWAFTTIPPGSAATLTNPTSATPTFVPDVIGMYMTQLIVHDGTVASTPDTMVITTDAPSISLALVNTTVVGVGRPATLQATLSTPAPAGGVTITVRSDQPTLLSITAPGTIVIPAGGTTGQVTVNGLAAGSATVRGHAPGYTEGTLAVSVTLNLISLPATLNVPLGQTVSVPVTIAPNPAPAGGVAVSLVSNNTSAVQVLTPTVTIPAGSLSANGTVRGAGIGMATITGSNANYAPATSQVSTTANLNIVQTSATVNGSFTADITVQIESAGSPIAAPAPGITVTLTAADPACAVLTSPVTILTGQVNTITTISGGTASRPCSTTVTASAPNIVADTVPVTVNPTPALTLSPTVATVGAGLQEFCCQVFLGAPAPAGGVQVQVQSSNAGTVLLAPDVATVGTSTLTLSLAAGSTVSNLFVVQGLETAPSLPATVTLTATAPGFTAATSAITVVQPGLRLSGGPTSTTTLSADTPFAVEVGVPNAPANTGLNSLQAVRVGGPTLTVTVTNAMAGVAQLTTSAGVGQSRTVQIVPEKFSTPLTVATGGVAFDPLTAGATTVQATIPGFIATTAATVVVTVTAPALTLFPTVATVGAGLQELCCQVFLGAPAPAGGVQVQVQSSDVGTVLLAPDGATVGTPTLTLSIAAGGMVSNLFVMQGLETAPSLPATVTLTATAPGFTAATSAITVVQPGLRLSGVPTSTTTLAADTPFRVHVGVPNAPANTGLNLVQAVRVGGPTLTATVTNATAGVAQLTTGAGSAQSRTVQLGPGQFSSPATVATGGVAFDPLTAGSTTVEATIPGFIATTAATAAVTVTASALTLAPTTVTVGAGLQELCCRVFLDTPAPAGGVQVQVQSGDAGTLLLAPDVGTVGTPTMTLTIAAGNSASNFFFVHGLETAPSLPATVTLTATAPGFTSATGAITVVSPGLRLLSVPISTTTLSADTPFRVQVGVPNAPTNTTVGVQAVRVGGPTLTATVTNAMAGVAQLTTSVGSAQSRTVQIGPGQSSTPLTVATGGVAFDPLTAGTTAVRATIPGFIATTAATVAVTVTAPALTLSPTVATVGAGLQELCCRVLLGAPAPAGGVQVQVLSSDAGTVLLAPDGATVGTSTLTLTIAAGNSASSFFVVQGLETAPSLPATVTLTATAPGFIDTTNAITVVQPGLRLSGVPPSTTMGSADTPFLVHVGVPNAPANTGLNSLQAVRVGGPTLTATVTNAVAGVAQLTTSAGSAQSRTVQIGPGQFSSPATVATGGVAFDPLTAGSTTVQATLPGFIATTAATVGVTVTP